MTTWVFNTEYFLNKLSVYSHVIALTSVMPSISPQIPEMKAFSVCVHVFGGSERAGGYGSGELIWKPDTPEKVTQEASGQPPMEQEPQKAPVREGKRMLHVKWGFVLVYAKWSLFNSWQSGSLFLWVAHLLCWTTPLVTELRCHYRFAQTYTNKFIWYPFIYTHTFGNWMLSMKLICLRQDRQSVYSNT